jgi:16S rRNA (guanine527-N7)-methyltransferase
MKFNQYLEMKEFDEGLSTLGIVLTDNQRQQFIDYYELLIEWNKVMNLTAITDLSEVVQKHFIDSLSLVKVLQPTKEKVLDVGTGAGFPGIPLKIVFPEMEIILLDSLKKRLTFLDEVINTLKLEKIQTLHGRAEDYGKDNKYREQFDLCVSRAVAKLSSLSEYCLPYVRVGGLFISYKSGKVEEELEMSAKAFQILGAKLKEVEEFKLPSTDIERTLVVLEKEGITPIKYPRSAGKPSKDPL